MKRRNIGKALQEAATDAQAAELARRTRPRRACLPEPSCEAAATKTPLLAAPAHRSAVERDDDIGPISWHDDASTLDGDWGQ